MSEINTTEVVEETEALTVEEIVQSLVTEDTYNAYGIHKIVNAVLEVLGNERRIAPQMMYNYSRNSMIEKGREKPNKDHVYSNEAVKAFVIKWANKNK